ncbi:MAG: deoxyribodipyrimidine photo-lyase [Armatimonadota bacterium]|nr:deoxyribodipyrimidine photo-lyase [bacterium]
MIFGAIMDKNLYAKRVVELNNLPVDEGGKCVIYWMQRSQRATDNPALNSAVNLANDLGKPLLVYFGLFDVYPMASVRVFKFMLEGLKEASAALIDKGIPFLMRREMPPEGIVRAAIEFNACAVVVDEDYLNIGRSWRKIAADRLPVRLIQIDAETIVPARITHKEEWGAYTIRPKILKALDQYMTDIPDSSINHKLRLEPGNSIDLSTVDPLTLANSLDVDQQVTPTPHSIGGLSEALSRLERFIREGLPRYSDEKNDIGVSVSSNLSPYLHFGQISSLRTALAVQDADAPGESIDAFLEQIIVRRELAINFCLYNNRYDSLDAASDWARRTLDAHRTDERPELYLLEELESAQTYDQLWNAAQLELVRFGRIHSYMRMVWAKNILVWSPTPEEALSQAIYLNDKYALDGRDPNGYANIAWCIFGKHDRPFAERPIFGKIRCMTSEATMRKTHWRNYIKP